MTVRLGMPSEPESCVGWLRHIGASKLHAWGLDALIDDAKLLISELATNAVRYGDGCDVELHLAITADELLMQVDDGSSARPKVRHVGLEEEGGRGMFLVAAIADRWGVSDDGTRTWCVLKIPESGRKSR